MQPVQFSSQDYAQPPAFGSGLYYDPLYGYIPLPPAIRRAIDLPSMQRVRHIRQLSTVELVFPGATHTRLEHSVGVYYVATMIYETLRRKKEQSELLRREYGPDLEPEHLLALQLAALFHDVGHGPYSHVFELFCERNPDFTGMHHEKMTERLICEGAGSYHDIPAYLTRLHEYLKGKERAAADFLSPRNVSRMATGKVPCDPRYVFLSQIVSDVCCDADRIDYLPRDAQHLKVSTGGVDVWELIHSFTLAPELDPLSGQKIWKLKVSKSAAKALEAFLAARDLAYRIVYYHPTHRAAQEMMICALHELTEDLRKFSPEELALLTDEQLLGAFREGTAYTRDVERRIFFRRLYEPLPFRVNVQRGLDEATQRRVQGLGKPKSKEEYESTLASAAELAKALRIASNQRVIFDLQPVPLTSKDAYTIDTLYDEASDKAASLSELLPHIKLLHGEFDIGGQKIDEHARYLREVSELQIALPFELIEDCVKQLLEEVHEPEEDVNTVAARICSQRLAPIFDHFMDFLGLKDPGRLSELKSHFDDNMQGLLIDCFNERSGRWWWSAD